MGLWYFCFQRGALRRPLPSDVIVLRLPVKFVRVLGEVEMADKGRAFFRYPAPT